MEAYYESDTVRLFLGDCLDVLPTLPDASVDAVVTDPPYELGFMGKAWDASGIAYNTEVWRQCWRVLKPGGHLVAFGGTRTYHRMTVAIEDAGFEIRDSMHWIYGSGFPKGQDIAKSIDKRRDDRAEVLQVTAWLAATIAAAGWTTRRMNDLFGFDSMAGHWVTQGVAAAVPTPEQWVRLRAEIGFDDAEILPLVEALTGRKGELGEAWAQREVIGRRDAAERKSEYLYGDFSGDDRITAPASDAARQWQGWNTALKPAHEPIVLARKSTGFNTTVANVLEHGTGALNIDATRTTAGQDYRDKCASVVGLDSNRNGDTLGEWTGVREDSAHEAGRWPTNILLGHGTDCVEGGDCQPGCPVAEMDQQSGVTRSSGGSGAASGRPGQNVYGTYGKRQGANAGGLGDTGGASRFFPVFRYEPVCDLFGKVHSCERAIGATKKYQRADLPQSSAANDALDSAPHDGEISELPAKSSAPTAGSPSPTTHQPAAGFAPGSAPTKPAGWSALRAASVGSLCDSCVTAIAQSVAAMQRGRSVRQELGLRSTRDSSERILNRSLALIAEDLESSGTTSTTTDLTTSLGCVVAAIKTYTTREFPSAARRSALPVLKYEAKASASERPRLADGTAHTTVKPLALMRWLVRLVTPPGGTVLDPFAGSGATLEACRLESFQSIGIEKDPAHAELCTVRLAKPYMTDLFGGAA